MKTGKNTIASRERPLLRVSILVAFIALAVVLVRFTPARNYFDPRFLQDFLDRAGPAAPVAFILLYCAGICLFIPATLLTGIGAAVFGPYFGFLYVWTGATLGATAAFLIGRTLGRDFAASRIGDRLQRYDEAIERNGFATVLYLRLIYFPFTLMSFGMGLTRVRFWDYFLGTAVGIIAGTFIFTFFIGTLKEIWISGQWGLLLSFRVFLALGLFVFSLFLPKIIKRIRGERPAPRRTPP